MKTTLELPDGLMRAIKVRAAATDRKLKDVVAEAIAKGLSSMVSGEAPASDGSGRPPGKQRRPHARVQRRREAAKNVSGAVLGDEALQSIFAAGDELVRQGVNFADWAKHSREVWR